MEREWVKTIMNLLMISNALRFHESRQRCCSMQKFHFIFCSAFGSRQSAVGILPFPISIQIERELIGWIGCVLASKKMHSFRILQYVFDDGSRIYSPQTHTHTHTQTNRHTLVYANNDSKEASFTRIRKRKRNTKARSMGCRTIDFMQFAHFAWTDRKMKWKPNIYFARYLSYSWAHAIFFRCCSLYTLAFSHCYLNWILCIFTGHILSLSRQYFVRFILGNVFVNCAISAI